MTSVQIKRVFCTLLFCLGISAAATAATVCATDNLGDTVVLKTDSDFAGGAIVGLQGWLFNGTVTIPVRGTALVDAAGQNLKVGIQGINNVQHKYVGIAIDSDLRLNGSGTFENLNSGRPFTYEVLPATWTALDTCPDGPPSAPSAKSGTAPAGGGNAATVPRSSGKNKTLGSEFPVPVGMRTSVRSPSSRQLSQAR